MSRLEDRNAVTIEGFPRVSGDEPQLRQWAYLLGRFSPRERG